MPRRSAIGSGDAPVFLSERDDIGALAVVGNVRD